MTTTIDINHTTGYTTSESSLNYLIEIVSKYSNREKFYIINIIMSNSTYNKCYSDLHTAFGDILDEIVTIRPDKRMPFGVIHCSVKDGRTGDIVEAGKYTPFSEEKTYDLSELKDEIVTKSPEFLITSMSTWGLINNLDFDNTDKYGNQVDYYHSYCKVPVAISEFVGSGQVILVK